MTLLKSRIMVSAKAVERLKSSCDVGPSERAVYEDGIGDKKGGEDEAVGHQVHPKS